MVSSGVSVVVRAAALAAVLAALLAPAPAGAAVTGGAPLNLAANTAEGCEILVLPALRPISGAPSSCTFFGLDPAAGWTSQTPRGRWVITRARVRAGPRTGPMVFTVVRAMRSQRGTTGIICCTSPAESQVFTPQPNAVTTVPVRLPVANTVENVDGEPVEVVDYLGVSLLSPASSAPLHRAGTGAPGSTATSSALAPALRAGAQALSGGMPPGLAPLVNGDFEPDANGNGLGDETQEGCAAAATGGARAARCPPAGVIAPGPGQPPGGPGGTGGAGDARGLSIRRPRLNRRHGSARLTVVVPGPGVVALRGRAVARVRRKAVRPRRRGRARPAAFRATLPVKPRRAVRRKLRRAGRARVKMRVTFVARDGERSSRLRRVTLRKRR